MKKTDKRAKAEQTRTKAGVVTREAEVGGKRVMIRCIVKAKWAALSPAEAEAVPSILAALCAGGRVRVDARPLLRTPSALADGLYGWRIIVRAKRPLDLCDALAAVGVV